MSAKCPSSNPVLEPGKAVCYRHVFEEHQMSIRTGCAFAREVECKLELGRPDSGARNYSRRLERRES